MNGLQKPHVVAVPFPALGHSIPFLDLSRLLASHGLTVSYVTTPANVSRLEHPINEAVSNGLDIRLVVLPTPPVEGLPKGRESADLLPREAHGLILQLADKLQQPFNAWMEHQFEQEAEHPVCVVHDTFIGWASESAEKYETSSVGFNVSGAFAKCMLYSVSGSILQKALVKEDDSVVLSLNLLRPLRFRRHEIAEDFFDPDLSSARFGFILNKLNSMGKGCGLLINTFQELEPAYVEHLRNLMGKPVWAIGPVLPPDYFSGAAKVSARGKMADISEEKLVAWLDSRSLRSVVYISFGSEMFLSERQTNALAKGLEASEQAFVWSIKVPPRIEPATSDGTDLASTYLPEGFLERTKNRGLVVWGWAPQLVILSHSSVGAFMSHCGWNSTMESITVGIPVIGWPMFGDQFFNIRLLEDLGVGTQFCQHKPGIPEEGKVKVVVRQVLNEGKGKEMRRRAERLKEMTRKAVEDGGSSKSNLMDFAGEMHKLLRMRRERQNSHANSNP